MKDARYKCFCWFMFGLCVWPIAGLIFVLSLPIPTMAQTTVSSATTGLSTVATCTSSGETWEELGTVCHSDPLYRKSLYPASGVVSITSGAVSTTPNCPADRTPVMVNSGTYKCAKDLTDPE